MKPALLLSAFLLLLPPNSVIAKNVSIGIYAIVDNVTFEPNSSSPDFVRISGVFVVPVPMSSGSYRRPQRGFLYFRIAPGKEQATRRDWSELRTVAGTGKVVGFGQYWVPNSDDPNGNPHHSLEVKVYVQDDGSTPDVYPIPQPEGIRKIDALVHDAHYDRNVDEIVTELRDASHQTHDPVQQAALKSQPQQPKWTEADEAALLAKAQQGDAGSQMWLGCAYEQGWFGKTDFAEALKWFGKSAAKGNPDAQNELGRMYEEGEGVKQDYTLAAHWYLKAAEHLPDLGGAGQGRNNLGMLYLDGLGVPKDYVQAYMWFKLADFEANPNLSSAKTHMTQEEILEAERLVVEWKNRHAN